MDNSILLANRFRSKYLYIITTRLTSPIILKATGQYDEIYKKWFGTLEPVGVTNEIFLKYLGGIVLAFLLISAVLMLWLFSLRKQVAARTRSLETEVQKHKQLEESLRFSEMELKEAQAIARMGSWKWDVKKGGIAWSDEMFRIFGIDKNTYTGRLGDVITRVIHPDDLHIVLPANAANIAAGPIEYRIILPDASNRNIWAKTGATVFDQDGKPAILTGVAQDITERRQAEDEIRRLSRFPAENPNPIMRFSKSGRILYANHSSEPILIDWKREMGQDLPADWCSRIAVLIESGQSQEVEVNCAGRVFSCILTPISGEDYLNLYGRDITERKQAEQKILYQATLLEKVSDAIVASDAQFRLTVWNAAAEFLFGWKADEVLGRNELEIMHTEWLAADVDEIRRTIREKGQHRGEATQSRKDGSRIDVEISSLVLRDENGNIAGYLSISHDITERKQVDEHLKEQLEELKRWHGISLGRESRILDLKHEVNDLLKKAGQPPRYPSAEKQDQGEIK